MKTKYRSYIDCETTGFCATRNDIVSLACIVTDNDFNIVGEFYETCRPEFNNFYSQDSEKIHGYSQRDMYNFQSRRNLCIKMLKFFKPFKSDINIPHVFVQHALRNFDYNFVNWAFIKEDLQYSLYKILRGDYQESTIVKAREMGIKENKLDQWAKRINFDLQHHDALSDAKCCLYVDKYLAEVRESGNIHL